MSLYPSRTACANEAFNRTKRCEEQNASRSGAGLRRLRRRNAAPRFVRGQAAARRAAATSPKPPPAACGAAPLAERGGGGGVPDNKTVRRCARAAKRFAGCKTYYGWQTEAEALERCGEALRIRLRRSRLGPGRGGRAGLTPGAPGHVLSQNALQNAFSLRQRRAALAPWRTGKRAGARGGGWAGLRTGPRRRSPRRVRVARRRALHHRLLNVMITKSAMR